ncbi:FAD-dependent oxidoreductase, partial [Streptomyces sp. NPDC059037]
GELALANGDHRAAFARYENRMRGYAQGCQKGGDRTGKFLAPATATGLRLRNALLSRRSLLNWMLKQGEKVSTLALPDYRAELSRTGR